MSSVTPFNRVHYTLQSGEVVRYHAVPTVQKQNLAHHQWNVAILLLHITDFVITKELLAEALLHDVDEQTTGDIPYTLKRDYPEIKAILEPVSARVREELTIRAVIELTPEERALLKVADTLDGFIWCHLHEDKRGPVEDRWHQAYLNARAKFAHIISEREWLRADALFCAYGGILRDVDIPLPCARGAPLCDPKDGCPVCGGPDWPNCHGRVVEQ